jgi:hypothetical protein
MSTLPPPSFDEDFSNPYAPPKAKAGAGALVDLDALRIDPEALRREYGRHEATVRAMGNINIIWTFVLWAVAAIMAVTAAGGVPLPALKDAPDLSLIRIILGVSAGVIFLFSLVGLAVGYGLRGLQTWARWTVIVLLWLGVAWSALALLLNVVALALVRNDPTRVAQALVQLLSQAPSVLIYIYFLVILTSSKSRVVFSPEYRAAVARTPHLRFSAELGMRVILVLVSILAGFVITVILVGFAALAARR